MIFWSQSSAIRSCHVICRSWIFIVIRSQQSVGINIVNVIMLFTWNYISVCEVITSNTLKRERSERNSLKTVTRPSREPQPLGIYEVGSFSKTSVGKWNYARIYYWAKYVDCRQDNNDMCSLVMKFPAVKRCQSNLRGLTPATSARAGLALFAPRAAFVRDCAKC